MKRASRSGGRALAGRCCRALAEKKAEDLRVLDVRAQSSITDFLVLASGTSEPHLRALRDELERVLDEAGTRLVGRETAEASGWMVVDAFDVMVHLFLPAQRRNYALESLWKDAREVAVAPLLEEPKRRTRAPAGPKRKSGA
jgi:ribosome-associated protein